MQVADVHALLEANKNERGIRHWGKSGYPGITSYGIGLTQLKKIARKLGRDHNLALALWEEPNYECMSLSAMIDEPGKVDRAQVVRQLKQLNFWMLSHTYCQNLLSRLPFMKELAEEWVDSSDHLRRRCGYLLLYYIARDDMELPDSYFEEFVGRIRQGLQEEENFVRDAMNNALWMIGQRNKYLHSVSLGAAHHIGKVMVDYGDNSCDAIDVVKHLEGDRIRKKVGY